MDLKRGDRVRFAKNDYITDEEGSPDSHEVAPAIGTLGTITKRFTHGPKPLNEVEWADGGSCCAYDDELELVAQTWRS